MVELTVFGYSCHITRDEQIQLGSEDIRGLMDMHQMSHQYSDARRSLDLTDNRANGYPP